MTIYVQAEWWPADGDDAGNSRTAAVEAERSDEGGVMVSVRGLSGDEDAGSFSLTLEAAEILESELRAARRAEFSA